MDEGRKQYATEVVEGLPLAEVRGRQVADYSGAAKIVVEKHPWSMAQCGSYSAGGIRGWHWRARTGGSDGRARPGSGTEAGIPIGRAVLHLCSESVATSIS